MRGEGERGEKDERAQTKRGFDYLPLTRPGERTETKKKLLHHSQVRDGGHVVQEVREVRRSMMAERKGKRGNSGTEDGRPRTKRSTRERTKKTNLVDPMYNKIPSQQTCSRRAMSRM